MFPDLLEPLKLNGAWYDAGDVMASVECVQLLPLLDVMPYLSVQNK